MPQRRRRERVGVSTVDALAAVAPAEIRVVGLPFVADEAGRRAKFAPSRINTLANAWAGSWAARSRPTR